jgi:hypothetical protein
MSFGMYTPEIYHVNCADQINVPRDNGTLPVVRVQFVQFFRLSLYRERNM